MSNQGDKWDKEYAEDEGVVSSTRTEPSLALSRFIDTYHPEPGRALDIGSGKGRNSVYLASLGFSVVGLELSEEAITRATAADGVVYKQQDLGEPWQVDDNEFDLAIDMMTLHLLNSKARENYVKELDRVLKTGALFLLFTVSANGEGVKDLLQNNPGPEDGTYVIPESGMVEKPFTVEELKQLFPGLEPLDSREYDYTFGFYGSDITVTQIDMVMRKK